MDDISINDMFDHKKLTKIIKTIREENNLPMRQYICIVFKDTFNDIHEHVYVTNPYTWLDVQKEFIKILKLEPLNIYVDNVRIIKSILTLQHRKIKIRTY